MSIIFTEENDIRIDDGTGQLIVGYFTPNYRERAIAFADNCCSVDLNVHLYAIDHLGSWVDGTQACPVAMMHAANEHPYRTLVKMDVDCTIRRRFLVDLMGASCAMPFRVKVDRKSGRQYVFPSSRIIAYRAGVDVEIMLKRWVDEMKRADLPKRLVTGNEPALMRAIARGGVTVQALEPAVSAYEADIAPDGAIIVHMSAHDDDRPSVLYKKRLKAIKRAIISRLMGRDYREWKYG